ncbi:MAG: peptidylprolyl isomerase, partial [Chloroflexota bacterium]
GISVSPEDIDQTMRSVFQGQSENASASAAAFETEFKEWYRQRLNESGLTDAEYRDIITIEIYRSRLQEYLAARMPTIADQAHVYVISVETQKEAEKIRARWAAGEKFTALAKELSLDKTTGDNGGEVGWFPRGGILTPQLEYEAFNLSTGNTSEPLPVISDQQQADGTTAPTVIGYNLILVTERANRELDANALQVLRSQVVDSWLSTERQNYNIKWHGLNNGFDSETYAWINYQLAKGKPKSTQK